jgi:hypothetical protein
MFTLFIVPSVYVLLAKDHSRERADQVPRPVSTIAPRGLPATVGTRSAS